jgi:hypothetical protein
MKQSILNRVKELEVKAIKPEPVHIIMKSYAGQSNSEAFDLYQDKRSIDGYTPNEGWEALKKEFLSVNSDVILKFITFDILPPVTEMKITRGK